MEKGLKKVVLGLVAVGLSITLLLTGAIPACEAGPDERVVKIGLHAGLSGPWPTCIAGYNQGLIDYVKYASDQELIKGIAPEVIWEDSGGSVSKSLVAHKRFLEADAIMEVNWNSTPTETLTPRLQADEMPMMYLGCMTMPMVTEPVRWVFSTNPGWRTIAWFFAKWAADRLVPEELPVRIGYIGYDNVSAREGAEGFKTAAQKGIKCELTGIEFVPIMPIDTSTELLRLAAKKPHWIMFGVAGAATTVVTKDFARLGLKDQIKSVTPLGSIFGENTINIVGRAAEGLVSEFAWPACARGADRDLPGVKLACEIAKIYRGCDPEHATMGGYIAGCQQAMVCLEGIRLAVEGVGLENLTRRAVRDGLASIKDFDTGGLMPPTTMSDRSPWYNAYLRMYIVREGQYELLSDWEKTPFFLEYFEKLGD